MLSRTSSTLALLVAMVGFSPVAFADDAPDAVEEGYVSMDIDFNQLNWNVGNDGQTLLISLPVTSDGCNTISFIGGWDLDHDTKTAKFSGQVAQTLKACLPPQPSKTIYLEKETNEIFLRADGVWTVVVPEAYEDNLFRRGWIINWRNRWRQSSTIYQMLFS